MRIKTSLALGTSLLAGCLSSEPDSSFNETELVHPLESAYQLWPQSGTAPAVVKICFAAQAYSETGFLAVDGFVPRAGEGPGYRDWIIDAIQEGWGRVANLQLDFYDSCPAQLTAGWLVIHFNDHDHAEESNLGYRSDHYNELWLNQNEGQGAPPTTFDHHACGYDQAPSTRDGKSFDSYEKLRYDAMHEFGHTLGFAHGQTDPNTPAWTRCYDSDPHEVYEDLSPGQYDYGSVMDYCAVPCGDGDTDQFGDRRPYFKARTSDWDVFDVQALYGSKQESGNQFIVGHRNTVVEVPASNYVAGQQLEVWDYKGGGNEQWAAAVSTNITARNASSLAWDVRGGTTSSTGTPIQLYPKAVQPNQQFSFKKVEWRGAGNNCLTALSNTIGSKIELQRCNGSTRQKWDVTYGVTSTQFKVWGTGLCATSPSTSPTDGLDLELGSCTGVGTRATFWSVAGGVLMLGGKCMDTETYAPSGDVTDQGSAPRSLDSYDTNFFPKRAGLKLQMFACKAAGSNLNQQFHLTGPITGLNNQCVDIKGGIGQRGAKLQLYPCTASPNPYPNPNQLWDAYIF